LAQVVAVAATAHRVVVELVVLVVAVAAVTDFQTQVIKAQQVTIDKIEHQMQQKAHPA
jgi:hypothetical protein